MCGVLVLFGGIRAFNGPTTRSLFGDLMSSGEITRALACGSLTHQLFSMVDPSAGGFFLYVFHGNVAFVYFLYAFLYGFSFFLLLWVPPYVRMQQPVVKF
ncbi:hypothetical protein BCY86_02975 [Pajaroellobacter abortibovis]|uniref:Major facilitator superfamily (MFS) profile domain-containing protein n=2 Tax=Pajaroellobacter abortibovis TaxID=1882918 RepID=A0A1L6MW47_9BACT|nr:hypothetical protein BCY86_02975 [Pajaroellobacter abortibovis]